MNIKKHLAFCGYNVFPHGFAQTQRLLLIAKGLEINNCNTTVICRYGTYQTKTDDVFKEGVYEGIKYKYCSGSPIRPVSFLRRNVQKLYGLLNEFLVLLKMRISGKLDYIFVTTNSFDNVLYYSLVSKLLFTRSVIDNMEFWSAVKRSKWSLGEKLHDQLSPILYSKVICISDFLVNHARKTRSKSKILKVPAIVDYAKFDGNDSGNSSHNTIDYLLFCGSAVYFPVIDFIIESFEKTNDKKTALIIVSSNGSKGDFEKLNRRISGSAKKALIELKSNLPYSNLVDLYKHSLALLIPLRQNDEDKARFPHKLGEYCASKSVIITTNNGEVPNYFTDFQNALVADSFDSDLFAEKMDYAIRNKSNLNQIRLNAYKTGLENFDYKINGSKIHRFLFNH
jgi:glycosyltransferase involved in cell wall biosynthesis